MLEIENNVKKTDLRLRQCSIWPGYRVLAVFTSNQLTVRMLVRIS